MDEDMKSTNDRVNGGKNNGMTNRDNDRNNDGSNFEQSSGVKTDRSLEQIRREIAACDDEVIRALTQRMTLIQDVIACKKAQGIPIFQPEQEKKQTDNLSEKLKGHWFEEEISNIYKYIVRNSRKVQAKELFESNIFLIGFMGAGKSTITRYLGEMLQLHTVDLDEKIEHQEKMRISEIFETYGEEYFRNSESNEILKLMKRKRMVISCGGGIVLREENVANMKKAGKIVLLTAEPETVLERVKDSNTRPLLNGNMNVEFIASMMDKRRELYMKSADIVIPTDHRDVHEICEELVSEIMKKEA